MDFKEYQKKALRTDVYMGAKDKSIRDAAFIEKLLGLVGETGEVAEKFKKIYRDNDGDMTLEQVELMKKELGDILWYVASISSYLDIDLNDVAELNIHKLSSRKQRGKLHGSGDNR